MIAGFGSPPNASAAPPVSECQIWESLNGITLICTCPGRRMLGGGLYKVMPLDHDPRDLYVRRTQLLERYNELRDKHRLDAAMLLVAELLDELLDTFQTGITIQDKD